MPADLVFLNGPIYTSRRDEFVEALAVDGEWISFVGGESEVAPHIGPSTWVVDLDDRLLTAGFQDAHVHPGAAGRDMTRVPLSGCVDVTEALAAIGSYAEDNPDHEWIRGSGWLQTWFPGGCPNRALLDTVVPDRPVFLENADGHDGWANSMALELAGIDANTPDPRDGRIERDNGGLPQGTLHEGARYLVMAVMPEDTIDDFRLGIVAAQSYLFSKGITGWQDAHVDEINHRAYRALAADGQLLGRAQGALWWDRHRGLEQIDEMVEMKREALGRYRPIAVKLMLDGIIENFSASMREPYLDGAGDPTANRGIDFIEPGELMEIVTRLDSLGFSCHFHAIGDGAVGHALDAVGTAQAANGVSDNRHHIAHVQVVHPDDISRFAQLGVTANCQPLWACDDEAQTELTRPFLGPERSSWQYPFGRLARSGARLAMGSDWGVSTPDVFEQADVAVWRTHISQADAAPLNPDEAIGAQDALIGFTLGSAYVNHLDDVTGTLEVGKFADLAVMDRNPLAEQRLAETLVDMTVIGGEVVYER